MTSGGCGAGWRPGQGPTGEASESVGVATTTEGAEGATQGLWDPPPGQLPAAGPELALCGAAQAKPMLPGGVRCGLASVPLPPHYLL